MSPTLFRRALASAALAAAAAHPAAAQTDPAVPFTVSVREITAPTGTPRLQSFALGRTGTDWVLMGGRRNGFHRTSTAESTFPTATANDSIYVVDLQGGRTWSAPLPAAYRSILRTSNTQYVQDGDNLYIVGGYGSTCDDDRPECYQTFPNLTVVALPALADLVKRQRTDSIFATIQTMQDARMRVTGGALEKIGNTFYLVMGHDYFSMYKGGVTGLYTEQVRAFTLSPTALVIDTYTAYGDSSASGTASQWHRRDLNVVPMVHPGGGHGLAIYGGVFTSTSGAWVNPMYMTVADGGTPAFAVDTFSMKMSLYESAHVVMYDPASETMYTTLLGGISAWYYNDQGNLVPGGINNHMPWTGTISTLARDSRGVTREIVQPAAQGLPGRRGGNAAFVPSEALLMQGSHDVIDYSRIPPGDSVMVGWMYGGIFAFADQSSEFNPTEASDKIYEVWLNRAALARQE
jgi:hypothetical protein